MATVTVYEMHTGWPVSSQQISDDAGSDARRALARRVADHKLPNRATWHGFRVVEAHGGGDILATYPLSDLLTDEEREQGAKA